MRRQVKPFVTEYRGGTRRIKESGGDAPAEDSRQRYHDEAERVFGNDPGDEGSYQAALRAADALFSLPAKPSAPLDTPDPRPARQPSLVEAQPAGPLERGLDEITGAPPRRILQAIEPLVEDRFASLEAERAPKRRGRKPGSKNKPKTAVRDDWIVRPAVFAAEVAGPAPVVVAANDDPAMAAFGEAIGEHRLPGPQRTRNDRFTRKRDGGLRPGERWKRRLPKAAW